MSTTPAISETRPLISDELLDTQAKLLERIVSVLETWVKENESTSHAKEGVREDCEGGKRSDPWARPIRHRSPRVILIDGGRGTGKTSLMLTLIEAWRLQRGLGGTTPEAEAWRPPEPERLDKLAFLPPVDLQSLPAELPLYAWLMSALRPVAGWLDKQKREKGGLEGATPFDPEAPRPWCERLDELQAQSMLGHNGHGAPGTMPIDDWLAFGADQVEAWRTLEGKWQSFVTEFLQALEDPGDQKRNKEDEKPALAPNSLLVLPIDDLDLYLDDGLDLILGLRRLWHPRLVFLMTGDSVHLKEVVKEGLEKTHKGDSIRRLHEELVEKAIPRSLRMSTPDVGLLEAVNKGVDGGVIGGLPALSPALTGKLEYSTATAAEMMQEYAAALPEAWAATTFKLRPFVQLCDDLRARWGKGARPLDQWRDVVVELAEASGGEFLPVALAESPPRVVHGSVEHNRWEQRVLQLRTAPARSMGKRKDIGELGETPESLYCQLGLRRGRGMAATLGGPNNTLSVVGLLAGDAATLGAELVFQTHTAPDELEQLARNLVVCTVSDPDGTSLFATSWPAPPLESPGQVAWLLQRILSWEAPKGIRSSDAVDLLVWDYIAWCMTICGVSVSLKPIPSDWTEPRSRWFFGQFQQWLRGTLESLRGNARVWLGESIAVLAAPEMGLSERCATDVLALVEMVDPLQVSERGFAALDSTRAELIQGSPQSWAKGGPDAVKMLDIAAPWSAWAQRRARASGPPVGWQMELVIGPGEVLAKRTIRHGLESARYWRRLIDPRRRRGVVQGELVSLAALVGRLGSGALTPLGIGLLANRSIRDLAEGARAAARAAVSLEETAELFQQALGMEGDATRARKRPRVDRWRPQHAPWTGFGCFEVRRWTLPAVERVRLSRGTPDDYHRLLRAAFDADLRDEGLKPQQIADWAPFRIGEGGAELPPPPMPSWLDQWLLQEVVHSALEGPHKWASPPHSGSRQQRFQVHLLLTIWLDCALRLVSSGQGRTDALQVASTRPTRTQLDLPTLTGVLNRVASLTAAHIPSPFQAWANQVLDFCAAIDDPDGPPWADAVAEARSGPGSFADEPGEE